MDLLGPDAVKNCWGKVQDKTSCLEDSETSLDGWKEQRPAKLPRRTSDELSYLKSCLQLYTICSRSLAFLNYHPCLDGYWVIQLSLSHSVLLRNPSPILLYPPPKNTLVQQGGLPQIFTLVWFELPNWGE